MLPHLILDFMGNDTAGAAPSRRPVLDGVGGDALRLLAHARRESDRYGRRPVILISLASARLGVHGRGASLTLLFIGRMVSGITRGAPPYRLRLHRRRDPQKGRARAFG